MYGPLELVLHLSPSLKGLAVELSSLPTHVLAEQIAEQGIFTLNAPFGSGRGVLDSLTENTLTMSSMLFHNYVCRIASNL